MPDMWMDVDAALTEVPVNIMPLIDDTDFKTREEAVTYDQAGMDLQWNFVTTAGAFTQTVVTPTTAGDYDWTNQGNGMYSIEIPASGGASINNDTEGVGWFTGFATGILPWRGPTIGFRAAAINNALIDGGDNLEVDVVQLGGATQSATDLKDFADEGYDPATNKVQGLVLADTVTTLTGHTAQTGDSYARIGAAGASLTDLGGMSTGMKAQVNLEADTALTDYDPPTRTEATSDKDEILAKMLNYVQLMVRSDAAIATDNATELTAINANEGSGAGDYSNQTEATEAIRDRGDAAWGTATTVDLNADQSGVTVGTVNAATLANGAHGGASATVDWDTTGDTTGNLSGSVGSVTGAVGSVTGNVGGNVTGSVGSLAAQAKTDVNAEVSDVMNTDTLSELSQAKPTSTPTFQTAIMLLYMMARNAVTVDSSEKTVSNDAGTVICKKALSDDGTTYTEAEMATGP